jgi:ornithine carbamoyltransferase
MTGRPQKRDFLTLPDFSRAELEATLELAEQMKRGSFTDRPLHGKTLAMIFAKSSTRTRVSFEVGTLQLGGHPIFLSSREIQLGRGEPIRDMARVLSRYVDGILIRTFSHEEVEELARWADVPVINGLTDLAHPCQIMADLLTARQAFGKNLASLTVAWIGDGNNVANSWLNAAYRFGFELRLALPADYHPDPDFLARAQAATTIRLTDDPREAAAGADIVTTDVWASMGQEREAAERAVAFSGYQVDDQLMGLASERAIFLHCLPAHRGEEVTDAVLEGPRSRIFEQAENRLHVQKAIMARLIGCVGAE